MTGLELLLIRRRYKLRQIELARRLRVDNTLISAWENDRKPIPEHRATEIKAALLADSDKRT